MLRLQICSDSAAGHTDNDLWISFPKVPKESFLSFVLNFELGQVPTGFTCAMVADRLASLQMLDLGWSRFGRVDFYSQNSQVLP
jgi:hypothetical protein